MKSDKWTRRSLMTGFGAIAAAFGVRPALARAQTSAGSFRPARHELDAWLDEMPGQHRVFIDSADAQGAGNAVLYANNLYRANQSAYSLDPHDVAIVVCFRHLATVFGYNDAMWAKYGEHFSRLASFTDPGTDQPPSANLYNADGYGRELPNSGNTIDAQIERGAQFAICDAATRFYSGQVARATGQSMDDVYPELVANAIPNGRFVSAGVVAATRSQEYGYSLLYSM
ncbi:MAG TPA: hypothetical protein QF572_12075 [Vicinamibacterales bacterium]|nr:hypothetical protein [Vicinamibacterales bacterium]